MPLLGRGNRRPGRMRCLLGETRKISRPRCKGARRIAPAGTLRPSKGGRTLQGVVAGLADRFNILACTLYGVAGGGSERHGGDSEGKDQLANHFIVLCLVTSGRQGKPPFSP